MAGVWKTRTIGSGLRGHNDDQIVRGRSRTRQVGPSKKGKEKATSVEVEKERTKDVEQACKPQHFMVIIDIQSDTKYCVAKQKSIEEARGQSTSRPPVSSIWKQTKSQQHSEKIASTEAPKHSDQHEIPPVAPTSTTTSFLALVGFGPVRLEESCDRCWRAGKICLVKKGMACLNCRNMKMKCTLTDKLRGKSQVQSKESRSSSHRPQSPSRVLSEVVPPVTPRPAKCRRSLSTNPTPGPSKVKAGADDRSSQKSEY